MIPGDRDPALRRFERDAVLACLGTAAMGFVVAAVGFGAGWGANIALGTLAGGLLIAVSYRSIKGGVDVLAALASEAGLTPRSAEGAGDLAPVESGPTPAAPAGADGSRSEAGAPAPAATPEDPGSPQDSIRALSRGRRVLLVVKFFTRYALLAVAAYVILSCFRLHPVGVVAGALAPFLAAVMQVGRLSRARARRQHP